MKPIFCLIIFAFIYTTGTAQTTKVAKKSQQNKSISRRPAAAGQTAANTPVAPVQPRETATDRYLKGSTRSGSTNTNVSSTPAGAANASPFAGGVYAAGDAGKTFDTLNANANNINRNTAGTGLTAGRDTAVNVNTIYNGGGITSNSGAVDRSGQSQFGQTNWGNSRSTVGESQWTIPPPITSSFTKEFPTADNATWTRSTTDTSIFSARYRSGTTWVTSNYNATGQRLDMRTEMPLLQSPQPVSAYLSKQPDTFKAVSIYKLQVQGKPDVYEIQTGAGKTVYVNTNGVEVNY